MERRWTVLLPVLTLFFASCTSVTVDRPFGSPPKELKAEDWEGTWQFAGGKAVELKVRDAAGGEFEIAGIEEEGGEFVLLRSGALLREHGDWLFLFLPDEPEGSGGSEAGKKPLATEAPARSEGPEGGRGEERWLWGRVINNEGQVIVLWVPSWERCRRSVEKGLLEGEVTEHQVHLAGLNEKRIELLKSDEGPLHFDWDEPLIFTRLAR